MVCAEIKKQQQLKTLTQQLKNVEVKEGQSELSLTKSLVYIVGWCHDKELFKVQCNCEITHCLNNKRMFFFSCQNVRLNF